MKKKIPQKVKNVLIFILGGIIIGGLGTAYAVSIASSSVSYDNTSSGATATDVKGAIDELYEKAKKCPQTPFKLGDYFTLVPNASTFTIKAATTGYDTDQTITPNELTKWRVIDIHSDGSVDAVSEYVSSTAVYFKGVQGYANFVGGLQTIAASYAKTGYTIATRMMGYAGQTPTIADTSAFDGTTNTEPSTTSTPSPETGTGQEYSGGVLGDTLYLKDYLLVKNVYGNVIANKVGTTTATNYWLSSRSVYYFGAANFFFYGRFVYASGSLSGSYFRCLNSRWYDYSFSRSVRPIITLKSGLTVSGGSGEKNSPYTLRNGNVSTFTFTIEGTTYTAEEGMTWNNWIGSSYDTRGTLVISSNSCVSSGYGIIDTSHSNNGIRKSSSAFGEYTDASSEIEETSYIWDNSPCL